MPDKSRGRNKKREGEEREREEEGEEERKTSTLLTRPPRHVKYPNIPKIRVIKLSRTRSKHLEEMLTNLRQAWSRADLRLRTQQRFLEEMLQRTQEAVGGYFVLILDARTAKLMGSVLKMSHLLEDCKIVMVESIAKERQPMRELPALYFLSEDCEGSVGCLIGDFPEARRGKGLESAYESAYIFWSSPLSDESMHRIKQAKGLLARPRSLQRQI